MRNFKLAKRLVGPQEDMELNNRINEIQIDVTGKRKRRILGDHVENSADDAKKPRGADKPGASDGRLPLAELQVVENSVDESANWIGVCSEKLEFDDSDESNHSVGSSPKPSPSAAEPNDDYLPSKLQIASEDLPNFFKLKYLSGKNDRAGDMLAKNPSLQPKMRSTLLEWIIEVCDVYKLHRETYHLAVDYLDRYLCSSENVRKKQLQLIGVTALFIASKYEEIYPPKVSDFAYITDGAFSDEDIVKLENDMLLVLNWRCTVTTSNSWVLACLQLLGNEEAENTKEHNTMLPQYKPQLYENIMHLLDFCTLDYGFMTYTHKTLALSALATVISKPNPVVYQYAGCSEEDLADCVKWMKPFWTVLCDKFKYTTWNHKTTWDEPSSKVDLAHMKSKHNLNLDMLEDVYSIIERRTLDELSHILLTPPLSTGKNK